VLKSFRRRSSTNPPHPALLCRQRKTYKSTWIDEAHEISPSTQQADAEQTQESVQKRKSATNFCEGICGEAMGNFNDGTTCAALVGCYHAVDISPSNSKNQQIIEEIFSLAFG
jgi:hypothetical protein